MTSNKKDTDYASSTRKKGNEEVSSLIISASNKAGMDGIDRSKIDAIIYRESHKSSYYKQQQRRNENVNQRIQRMEENYDKIKKSNKYWKEEMEELLDNTIITELLNTRRKLSTYVVFDMDSFYISCEYITKPYLRNVPACVGHSMISTSNYCARKYGVRSAMPGFIGDTLVHELSNGTEKLIHVDLHFDLYKKKSMEVKDILLEYDPNLKMYSLDEAYVNLYKYTRLRLGKKMTHGQIITYYKNNNSKNNDDDDDSCTCSSSDYTNINQSITSDELSSILEEIRSKVHTKTGLTCSAGLANNFMLAKIASDINKPNGQKIIGPTHEEIINFISDLNIRKVPGIGRVTEKILNHFDVHTICDLYQKRALISHLFTTITSKFLLCASIGWNDNNDDQQQELSSETSSSIERKGISRERTFSSQKTYPELIETLHAIIKILSNDMNENSLKARTLILKIKLSTFDTLTRSYTIPSLSSFNNDNKHFENYNDMVLIATDLFHKLKNEITTTKTKGSSATNENNFRVRLIGVRCCNFIEENTNNNKQLDIMQFMNKKKNNNDIDNSNSSNSITKDEDDYCLDDDDDVKVKQMSSSSSCCPICHKVFQNNNISNEEFNLHLDLCLKEEKNTTNNDNQSNILQFIHRTNDKESRIKTDNKNDCLTNGNNAAEEDENSGSCPSLSSPTQKCPICHKVFKRISNEEMNQHLDICLTSSKVVDLTNDEEEEDENNNALPFSPSFKKPRTLTDFFYS